MIEVIKVAAGMVVCTIAGTCITVVLANVVLDWWEEKNR